MAEEIVSISKKEYDQLKSDSAFLQALMQAGVDNWEGFSDAQDILSESEE